MSGIEIYRAKTGRITQETDKILCSLILKIAREIGHGKNLEAADVRKAFLINK